ncbi:MAG: hydroxyacylglutathione hydrolase C-terminal domain-containing protein, partial [Myxococcota bacterium]
PATTRVCCAHEYTQDNLRFAWSIEPDNAGLAERIRRVWATRAEGRTSLPSTIEEERATNPFLRPGSPTLLASLARADPSADLTTPERVFAATRRLKDTKAYKAVGDAGLPL